MVLKRVFIAIACTTSLACGGLAAADEYRPGEFLGLDLSRAVLSPKPLGPSAYFVPGPLDATVDHQGERAEIQSEGAQALAEPNAGPKVVIPRTKVVTPVVTRVVHATAEKPRGAARTRLARRHSNPLDAQALDARIQVWPCKSGGICSWKR
jgi:hypothetical protein